MEDDLDGFFDEIDEAVAEVTEKGEEAEDETAKSATPVVDVDADAVVGAAAAAPPPSKKRKVAASSANPARPKGAVVAASAASAPTSSSAAKQQQQIAPPLPPPPPPPAYPNTGIGPANPPDSYFGPGSNHNNSNNMNNNHGRGGNHHHRGLPPLPPGPMPPLPPGPPPPPNNSNNNINAKPMIRLAAGKSWTDSTLSEWPENDFRIFVGNLGAEVDEPFFHEHFRSRYPSVAMSKIVKEAATNKSKGYGFVSFLQPLDCARAIREQDQAWIGSRPVRVKRSDWQDRNQSAVRKRDRKEKKQQKRRGGGGSGRY